ncbi:MAG: DUF2490 domain-containing protein [Myxococcota bacterium]
MPAASTTDYAIIGVAGDVSLTDTLRVDAATLGLIGDLDGSVQTLGVRYAFSNATTVRLAYFRVFEPDLPGRPDPRDHRIRLELTHALDWGAIRLSHRSRLEHRFRDLDDQTRYRPQLRVTYTLFAALQPFVSAEPFFLLNDLDTQLVILDVGALTPIHEHIALAIFDFRFCPRKASLYDHSVYSQWHFGRDRCRTGDAPPLGLAR